MVRETTAPDNGVRSGSEITIAFAAPVGQKQIRDTECGALTLNQASTRRAYGSDPDDCW